MSSDRCGGVKLGGEQQARGEGGVCLREEDLRASPVDPKVYMESYPLTTGQHGFVKGVNADWPQHIWEKDENEPSMLGARNGKPDPPRRASQYQGWGSVRCEELWGLY